MIKKKQIIYPIVIENVHNKNNNYYVATSPKIPDLVIHSNTVSELVVQVQKEIVKYSKNNKLPSVQDPTNWNLNNRQQLMWINVDLQCKPLNRRTIRRSITVPEYLNEWAKKHEINVSRLTTERLEELYNKNN